MKTNNTDSSKGGRDGAILSKHSDSSQSETSSPDTLREDGTWHFDAYTKHYTYWLNGEIAIDVSGEQFHEATQHLKYMGLAYHREAVLRAIVNRAIVERRSKLSAVGERTKKP